MYSNNRDAYRQAFFTAWQKYQKKIPLEAVEAQLIDIILLHPEYHSLLDKNNINQTPEFALEENPFFHMSLHLAMREQLHTNRPAGMALIHQQLIAKYHHAHDVEHQMMACLSQMMWKAQQTGVAPNETEYLEKLRAL